MVRGVAWTLPVVTVTTSVRVAAASPVCVEPVQLNFNSATYVADKSAPGTTAGSVWTGTFSWADPFGPGTGTLQFVLQSELRPGGGGLHPFHLSRTSGPASGTGYPGVGMVLYRTTGERGAAHQTGQFLYNGSPYTVENFRFDFGDIDARTADAPNAAAERLGFLADPYPTTEQVVNRRQVAGSGRFGNGATPWQTASTAVFNVDNTTSFDGNVQIAYASVQSFQFRYDVSPPRTGSADALSTYFIPQTFTAPCPTGVASAAT